MGLIPFYWTQGGVLGRRGVHDPGRDDLRQGRLSAQRLLLGARRSDGRIGLRLPDHTGHSKRRYPVQLLELASALVLLAGSAALLVVDVPRGAIFAFALTGYGAARFAIDPLRERPPRIAASRRVALTAFLACAVLASAAGWLATGT